MTQKQKVMGAKMKKFIKSEEGATAIEYGLIAALIGMAMIGSLGVVYDSLSNQYTEVGTSIDGVQN
jgi:pilus assembly protein Flp/PilA